MKLEFAWLYLLRILSFVCVTILVHCLLEAKVLDDNSTSKFRTIVNFWKLRRYLKCIYSQFSRLIICM